MRKDITLCLAFHWHGMVEMQQREGDWFFVIAEDLIVSLLRSDASKAPDY